MTPPMWPAVERDEHGQMTCPVRRCDQPLYLVRSYNFPLIAHQEDDYTPTHSLTEHWQVECVAGHVLWTIADEAGVRGEDISEPTAEYDHMSAHMAIQRLGGERL